MAGRIRTIKPELLENARTGKLDDEAWRLYVSLLLLADDYGNLYGDPDRIGGAVFWSGTRRKIPEILARLSRAGLTKNYQVNGQPYVSILGWAEHQRVDKPGKPRVPGPNQQDTTSPGKIRETPGKIRETPAPDIRETIDDRRETTVDRPAGPVMGFDLEAIYIEYPRKVGRKLGLAGLSKQIRTAEDYEIAKQGVIAFAAAMLAEGRPVDKIPHFSTWVNREEWRDYAAMPANGAGRQYKNFAAPRPHIAETSEEDL